MLEVFASTLNPDDPYRARELAYVVWGLAAMLGWGAAAITVVLWWGWH